MNGRARAAGGLARAAGGLARAERADEPRSSRLAAAGREPRGAPG
jgi:hypothetical protein